MSLEIIFLIVLAFIWIIFATFQDLKTNEISNWISFSLIIFAMALRFFYSLFNGPDFGFFYQGLMGLIIFIVIGHLLYYVKFFAGGDAKLFMALGPVIPFAMDLNTNVKIFAIFLLLFLLLGALYSLSASIYLSLINFRKFQREFSKQFKQNRILLTWIVLTAIIFIILGFIEEIFLYFGILFFIFPWLYIYTKSVDESCMIKKIKTTKLTEGDWLYKNLKIGKKSIKARWEGLSKEEIFLIRKKHKYVLIRQGVPFSPVFLLTFLAFIYFWQKGFFGLI
ncbi:MAG: prepilin peptidase [Candidatus Pacearchaeota archaeon]